ncbi:MAG: type IV pilus modification protein PilV [Ideonella sp.]|nr:type IV pilus modification protein PilV [Ideonella sp.]
MRRQALAKPQQTGIALFEILAAMMVLSMSFLGTALLLAKTAKEERSAIFMGRAASLASDMAERIRSSPAAMDNYLLAQTYDAGSAEVTAPACGGLFTAPGKLPADKPACTNAAGAASYDLASWQVQVQSNLPGGVGRITAGSNSNVRTIVVGWSEPALDRESGTFIPVNDSCPKEFSAPESVRCYVMEVRP